MVEIRCADLDRLKGELAETGRITINSKLLPSAAKLYIARALGPVDTISEMVLPDNPLEIPTINDELYQNLIREARIEAENSPCWVTKVGCLILEGDQIIDRSHNRPVLKGSFCQGLEEQVKIEYVSALLEKGESLNFCQTIHDVEGAVARAARDGRSIGQKTWVLSLEPCDRCANALVVTEPKAVYFSLGIGRQRYYNSVGLERLVQAGIQTYFVEMPEENAEKIIK